VRVRDVAARAAADENFRAESMCAVEDGDGCGRVKALGEKGGREAGGAAADYRDITDVRERRGQASSVRV